MPDPVLADFFRAHVVFHGPSGLPEDIYVNSGWCFRDDSVVPDISNTADTIRDVVAAFYNKIIGGVQMGQWMPSYIADLVDVFVYDLGETPPRTRISRSFTLAGQSTDRSLPEECCACISYVAGENQKRNRGRMYIGPLVVNAVESASGSVRGVLLPALIARLKAGMEDVFNTTEDVTWHLLSKADGAAKMITGGWVDNAFDTQRRRGVAATTRSNWGSEV